MTRVILVLAGLLLAALVLALAIGYAPDRPVESLLARCAPPPSAQARSGGELDVLANHALRQAERPGRCARARARIRI
jgi:hypothetical protein